MRYVLELDNEEDGRWIAEIPGIPGGLAYGDSPRDASNRGKALALRVIADRLEHAEEPSEDSVMFVA